MCVRERERERERKEKFGREREDTNGTHNGVSNLSLGHMAGVPVGRAERERGEYGERK